MFDSKGIFSILFNTTNNAKSKIEENVPEEEAPETGWSAFAVCVFKRFIIVFVIGLIGANFIYLSGISDSNLERLFPTDENSIPKGPFCCGEPDMSRWPYTMFKDAPPNLMYKIRNQIILATKDTYTIIRTMIRQLLQIVGGFANSTGTFGRWSTYVIWNFAFQLVGVMVPMIATGLFWINVLFHMLRSIDIPALLDPNKWTLADWAYFYGVKENMKETKWLYFSGAAVFTIITIVVFVSAYVFVALPLAWGVSCCVSACITILFYLTFIFLPVCRDQQKLRGIMARDHKFLLTIFGLLCILDAKSTLDSTTSSAMQFVYILFVLHALYEQIN